MQARLRISRSKTRIWSRETDVSLLRKCSGSGLAIVRSVPRLTDPFNRKTVVAGLDPFCCNAPPQQVRINIFSVNNPEIASVRQNVQPPTAVAEYSTYAFPPTVPLLKYRTHLAPQNSKTFRT